MDLDKDEFFSGLATNTVQAVPCLCSAFAGSKGLFSPMGYPRGSPWMGCSMGYPTLGFPTSFSKHNQKLNIQYYQYVVHGIHETSPTCLQKINLRASILMCFLILSLGACPGTPWRPSWDVDPKNTKASLWLALLYEHICDRRWYFCGDSICLLSQAPAGVNFEGFGPQCWSQSEQIWKSGNCDSCKRQHHNQASEGIYLSSFS